MAQAPRVLPRASAAKVAYHASQLSKMLARSDDLLFLRLIWATDALQSDRVEAAAEFLTYPPAAAVSRIDSPFAIHRWELETLTIQLFLTAKREVKGGGGLALDCSKFDSIRETINRLRSLENVESASYLGNGGLNIFSEMHRIAQRQFHWQHGYFNLPQFYRYLFIYGQGQCAGYFSERYGLSPSDLALTAFAYFATYQRVPWIDRIEVPGIGLTQAILDQALPMISMEIDDARKHSNQNVARINEQHGQSVPTYAYDEGRLIDACARARRVL